MIKSKSTSPMGVSEGQPQEHPSGIRLTEKTLGQVPLSI